MKGNTAGAEHCGWPSPVGSALYRKRSDSGGVRAQPVSFVRVSVSFAVTIVLPVNAPSRYSFTWP